MKEQHTVALYGNSLFMAGVESSLRGRPGLDVVWIDDTLPGAAQRLHALCPDVVVIALLASLALVLLGAQAGSSVTPTPQWVNFYGLNSFLDGQPLPVGAVVAAYDPQGVQCGEVQVSVPGWYGLMAVYGDDPQTPGDEGAQPGDPITFTVNRRPAVRLGPDPAVWTGNGDRREVNLGAKTTWRCQLLEDVQIPCDCLVDGGDLAEVAGRWRTRMGQASYSLDYDIEGDGDVDAIDVQRVAARWGVRCP